MRAVKQYKGGGEVKKDSTGTKTPSMSPELEQALSLMLSESDRKAAEEQTRSSQQNPEELSGGEFEKVKEFLMRQVIAESGGNPAATSYTAGGDTMAMGIAQITQSAIDDAIRRGWVGSDFDPYDPAEAIPLQIKIMERNMTTNKGDVPMRLNKSAAQYNTGNKRANDAMAESRGAGHDTATGMEWLERLSPETRNYIPRILGTDAAGWHKDTQPKYESFEKKYGSMYTPQLLEGFYKD
jgi:hypothetical protein